MLFFLFLFPFFFFHFLRCCFHSPFITISLWIWLYRLYFISLMFPISFRSTKVLIRSMRCVPHWISILVTALNIHLSRLDARNSKYGIYTVLYNIICNIDLNKLFQNRRNEQKQKNLHFFFFSMDPKTLCKN